MLPALPPSTAPTSVHQLVVMPSHRKPRAPPRMVPSVRSKPTCAVCDTVKDGAHVSKGQEQGRSVSQGQACEPGAGAGQG